MATNSATISCSRRRSPSIDEHCPSLHARYDRSTGRRRRTISATRSGRSGRGRAGRGVLRRRSRPTGRRWRKGRAKLLHIGMISRCEILRRALQYWNSAAKYEERAYFKNSAGCGQPVVHATTRRQPPGEGRTTVGKRTPRRARVVRAMGQNRKSRPVETDIAYGCALSTQHA
jgi:hypothetical protein